MSQSVLRPLLLITLVGFLFLGLLAFQSRRPGTTSVGTPYSPKGTTRSNQMKQMHPKFELPPLRTQETPRSIAAKALKSVYDLPAFMKKYPDTIASSLFSARIKKAQIKIPDTFADKVKSMFARYPGGTENLNFIENQNLATTYNLFTDEYSMFNEIRRYRPGYMEKLSPEADREVLQYFNETSGADKCDFCRRDRSAIDVFGRVEGKHWFTASNVAHYEQHHGLLLSKVHNPLHVTKEHYIDMISVSKQWFKKANELDPQAQFPHGMYDAGPKASASQSHSHVQLSLTQSRYYSKAENTRQAAIDYEEENPGRNYWSDVIKVHEDFGLAVRHGNSAVLSHLCPVKEKEMIIVTSDTSDPSFAELMAMTVETMTEDVGTRAFSAAILFRQLGYDNPMIDEQREQELQMEELKDATGDEAATQAGGRTSRRWRFKNRHKLNLMAQSYPALVRIVDRGNPQDKRSDVGAMEFFGANNVGADPYHIMPHLRRRVLGGDVKKDSKMEVKKKE